MTHAVVTVDGTSEKTAGCEYVGNMRALWRTDARLAMAIEAVAPEDVPGVERAKDGNWTVRVGGGAGGGTGGGAGRAGGGAGGAAGGVYLHSKYRPAQEAQAWAEAQGSEGRYAVVVCGFGLGHHVKALFERLPGDALLVVAEPNLGVMKAALGAVEMGEMLGSGRVMIFTSLDRGALVDRLEPRSVLFTAGAGTLLTTHPASVGGGGGGDGAFHRAFQKLITEFIAFTRTGFVTLMLNNVATCRNVANNLGRYATTPPLDLMRDAYKGKPAVLVAAGPSLAKNMHLLHEVAGGGGKGGEGRRAVIIAVQTMLKPLLAAGIEPDFVTSLDYNTVSTRFFENLEESGSTGRPARVHLVAEAKANWNVLDVFGGTMSLTHNDFAERLLRGAFPARAGLKAGATVAHLSFYLAEYLGCDPIILVGQDLGFVDGLYYKPGTAIHETWGVELGRFNTLETKEWERIVRSRQILRKIPDIHGHPMYTEEQFFVYLQQFERDFAGSRCRVIDATEGGARKQGVRVMTLRGAIDEYCSGQWSVASGQCGGEGGRGAEAGHGPPATDHLPWKGWECDMVGNLGRVKGALEARRAAARGMKETCEKTIPILREMIEKQGDATRMNQLFVEVDRLRGKVGDDPATFEMVTHLNAIGELRRYQADLLVKTAKQDPMERQKRQLMRDVEYVGDLKVGAERLLEIVEEALRRLERQMKAVGEGKGWPREVAGS